MARQLLRRIKTRKNSGKRNPSRAELIHLLARMPIMRSAVDKKVFEDEIVFPAVERSAATEATHFRVNRRYSFNLHQRVLCRAMRAVERICAQFFCHGGNPFESWLSPQFKDAEPGVQRSRYAGLAMPVFGLLMTGPLTLVLWLPLSIAASGDYARLQMLGFATEQFWARFAREG
jgi:hypothetical protein